GANGINDGGGKLRGRQAVLGRNNGRNATANAGHKRLKLSADRLDIFNRKWLDSDQFSIVEMGKVCDLAGADLIGGLANRLEVASAAYQYPLALLIVDRHIGVAAEDAQLPFCLEGKARCCEIGHAAILKAQPGIAD